jgi:tetratricopeptide (TPR) repeat protein
VGQLESMKQSLAIGRDLLKANPEDRRLQRGMAIANVKVGYALGGMGSRAEAMQFYKSGLDMFEILAKDQTDARSRRELSVATSILAGTQLANGEWEAALAGSQRALVITDSMAKEDPQNVTLQLDLAGGYLGVGSELVYVGRYSEAEATLERAIRGYSEVLAHNRSDQQAPHYIALIELWRGEALARSGNAGAAVERFQKGATALDDLGSSDPDIRAEAASARVLLGRTLAKQGRTREAAEAYRKALAIAEPLASAKPSDTGALYAVADAYFGMGELAKMAAGKFPAASMACRKSWTDAHDSYTKSAAAWNEIPNPGAVTPSNLPCGSPAEVARAIARCNAALAKKGA